MAQWVKPFAMKVWSGNLNSVIRFHMKVDQKKKKKGKKHLHKAVLSPSHVCLHTQHIFM